MTSTNKPIFQFSIELFGPSSQDHWCCCILRTLKRWRRDQGDFSTIHLRCIIKNQGCQLKCQYDPRRQFARFYGYVAARKSTDLWGVVFFHVYKFCVCFINIGQRSFLDFFILLFLRMLNNVLILDFGSQYTQLIARRVRELNIFCEIKPYNKIPEDLSSYKAVILSGSPFSGPGRCGIPSRSFGNTGP